MCHEEPFISSFQGHFSWHGLGGQTASKAAATQRRGLGRRISCHTHTGIANKYGYSPTAVGTAPHDLFEHVYTLLFRQLLLKPSFGALSNIPMVGAAYVSYNQNPVLKMVNPEPCKELRRRPQLFLAGIGPY